MAVVSDHAIAHRLNTGLWERVHPGVYRLAGTPGSPNQDLFAAWLAAGSLAVASHGSAAFLWRLLGAPTHPALTVPRPQPKRPVICRVGEAHSSGSPHPGGPVQSCDTVPMASSA
jgi:hypothetical protein